MKKIYTIILGLGIWLLIPFISNAQHWETLSQQYTNTDWHLKMIFASGYSNIVTTSLLNRSGDHYISFDGGDSWSNMDSQFDDIKFTGVSIGRDGSVLIGTHGGEAWSYVSSKFYKSPDGLSDWEDLGQLFSPDVVDQNTRKLYDVTRNNTFFIGRGTNIQKSTDNGQTWNILFAIPLSGIHPISLAASYSGDTIIIGSYNQGIYYSHDGGESFQSSESGIGNINVGGVFVLPNGTIIATALNGFYKSTDGGVSFNSIDYIDLDTNEPIYAMFTFVLYNEARNQFYLVANAGGNNKVFVSTDACATWKNITGDLGSNDIIDFAVSKDHLFAVKSDQDPNIYRIKIDDLGLGNSGVSTTEMNNVFMYPNPATHNIYFENLPEKSTISIINNLGQLVYQSNSENTPETIDVSSFAAGIYMVKIDSNHKVISKKLVVK